MGINLNFVTKSGLTSQLLSAPISDEAFRSLSGGMMYTCGLSNVGQSCLYNGQQQVFHGRARTTAAENVSVVCEWIDDEYEMKICGEMKEAQIFKENLVLRRQILTKLGDKKIVIKNEVENMGFESQEIMLMFHVNPGFPILDEGSKLLASIKKIKPRDEISKQGLEHYNEIIDPQDSYIEQVFYIEAGADQYGNTMVAFVNPKINLGVYLKYNTINLPELIFWKSMASGDYAVGIEPSNCYPEGKINQKEINKLCVIESFKKLNFDIEIGVLDSEEEIESFSKTLMEF